MSPAIETTATYKTTSRTSAGQFPCTTRTTSPPASISSNQSSTCNGNIRDAEEYNNITKKRSLAGAEVHHSKLQINQEEKLTGTGNRNAQEKLSICCGSGDDDPPGGLLDYNRNNNSSEGVNVYQPLIHQEPVSARHARSPLLGINNKINKSTASHISQDNIALYGSQSSPVKASDLHSSISLSPFSYLSLESPVKPISRHYESDGKQPDRDNVRSFLSSNYVRNRISNTMAAEGDNKTEPEVQQEPKVKPRKKVTSDPNHVSHQFFHLEPCLYSHRMFIRAAQIFDVLKQDDADTEENKALRRRQGSANVDKGKIPEMDFMDAQEQIKTFELTFATLKFQKLFSCILDYIGFFHEFSDLRRLHSLCYVILYDLQIRKFQKRIPFPEEVSDPDCSEVEDALLSLKTKLQANIAKERVKNDAPSIEYLLPEHIRNKDETKTKTPVYLWVNQFKSTVDDMVENLKSQGFEELSREADMSEQSGNVFIVDPHCSDLLTFPPDMDMDIKKWDSVLNGTLVQQDKSSCLAPQSVPYLIGPDHDVIHVNVGTAITTCHIASLLRHKNPTTTIFAFGVDNIERARKVGKNFEYFGVKNIRVVQDEFLNADPEDSRFKSVRVILISANCSKSAITSPVQFIVSEGEDTQILGKLSVSETDMTMVGELMAEHERLLKHAFRFPKLHAVVYITRSRHEAENEVVVTKVVEYINMTSGKKPLFKVVPPVIPFCGDEINSVGKNGVDGRFIRFLPSDRANGCFVAVIAKEPEDPRDTFRAGRGRSKGTLNKSKSVASGLTEGAQPTDEDAADKANSKNGRKSLRGAMSSMEIKTPGSGNTLKTRLSQIKLAAGAGARLYQAGLIKKMENSDRTSPSKPEHLKVVKHPAPFRDSEEEDKGDR